MIVVGAVRCVSKSVGYEYQRLIVRDGDGEIVLEPTREMAAGLTPEQARWIARLLCEAASRVEAVLAERVAQLEREEDEAAARRASVAAEPEKPDQEKAAE